MVVVDKTDKTEDDDEEDTEKENDSAFNILTLEIENMKKNSSANPSTKRKLMGNNANFAPLIVEEMLDYTVE